MTDAKTMFETDGRNISPTLRERFATDPAYRQKIAETVRYLDDYQNGRIAPARFAEAMTTGDLPGLLGGVIDRTLLAGYEIPETSYQDWCKINRDVKDFRELERHYLDRKDGTLSKVKQGTEYPISGFDEGKYTYRVEKYGDTFAFTYEDFVNDDLGALTTIPKEMGEMAKWTTEQFATSLICDENGPHATVFNDTIGNSLALALSADNLETAAQTMAKVGLKNKTPIGTRPKVLLVPPTLEMTAKKIVKALQVEVKDTKQTSITQNLFQDLTISVGEYIPRTISGATGEKSWFLFPDPNRIGRPVVELGFLRGHAEPQLIQQSSDATLIGGGALGAFAGSFKNDGIGFRVRHIVGGAVMNASGAVGSNGG